MGDPVSLGLGAALTAGSAFANNSAANSVAGARNAALADNAAHQAAYDATIAGLNQDALSKYSGMAGQTGTAQTGLANLYRQGVIGNGGPPPPSVMPLSASNATNTELAKQTGIVNAKANGQADTRAALEAPGLALSDANLAAAPDFSQMGQQNNFKTGYAGTLPLALDAAAQQGAGMKTFADLLGMGGSLGLSMGAPSLGQGIARGIQAIKSPFPFGIP